MRRRFPTIRKFSSEFEVPGKVDHPSATPERGILGSFVQRNRATIACAIVIALLLVGLFAWTNATKASGDRLVALVHDGDGQVHELPLGADATLEVTTSLGSNTVVVENGAVRVASADCPNGTCLHEHPLSEPGRQIICLPHKLWIEVVPEGADGGEMDVSLVEGDDNVDLVAR